MISDETIRQVAHIGWAYPDGVHSREELRRLEPGRRDYDAPCPCGCGAETRTRPVLVEDVQTMADAKACAEGIIRACWAHGFTAEMHVDAMNRLIDRVRKISDWR